MDCARTHRHGTRYGAADGRRTAVLQCREDAHSRSSRPVRPAHGHNGIGRVHGASGTGADRCAGEERQERDRGDAHGHITAEGIADMEFSHQRMGRQMAHDLGMPRVYDVRRLGK